MSGNAHVRCEAGENPEIVSKDYLSLLPKIESAEMMFSASRSRRLSIVPIIQSLGQLEKSYGKEGAEIIIDNTQLTIFGGFAPNSKTAPEMSSSLGNQTVQSGSISKGKNDPSQSLQMIERPLMMTDELKTMPKGQFIVMKTGTHPMKVKLKLFFKWGITFGEPYQVEDKGNRPVAYAGKQELVRAIQGKYPPPPRKKEELPDAQEISQEQLDPREHFHKQTKASRMPKSTPAHLAEERQNLERSEKMTDLKRLYQSDLPSRAIAVYLYLRGRANKEGFCWPAIPTMARELKMSESTIRRALQDLVREGFLIIEERQRESGADSSNNYRLLSA